jgi:hypothetical protein
MASAARKTGPKTRAQIRRALDQRRANARAAAEGAPLPFPNPWDAVDHTKVPRDATAEQIHIRYIEFRKLCPPPSRRKHSL